MIKSDKDLKEFIKTNENEVSLVINNLTIKKKTSVIGGKCVHINFYQTDSFYILSHEKHVTRFL